MFRPSTVRSTNSNFNQNNNNNKMTMMSFGKKVSFNTVQQAPPVIQEPPKKKVKWGQPTWFLLHTLAEKVKPEVFFYICKPLLNVIFKICTNLPCPDCANHATKYLQGINLDTITTKEQLKTMLWQFHNVVNEKKNYPILPRQDLDEKYRSANTINIIRNFIYYFEQRHNGMHLSANKFNRDINVVSVKKWLAENIQYFDL